MMDESKRLTSETGVAVALDSDLETHLRLFFRNLRDDLQSMQLGGLDLETTEGAQRVVAECDERLARLEAHLRLARSLSALLRR